VPFDDLIWERLRYRFVYVGEATPAFTDTVSISQILLRPVVHILGQSSYFSGGKAALRLIVTDTANQPVASGNIRIQLLEAGHPPRELFTGHLDKRGTAEAQFRFPIGLTGSYQLHFAAETPIGSAEDTQTVRLQDKASILLSTEKPIYQPGQTIHVRALALERADRHAAASRPLTFELEDSRGNKVFKKITQTDAFGIASAEFALADEVNLGTYHLRALMSEPGDTTPTNTAELALNVQKYVLPKFKVAVDFSKSNGKPKRDYRPGDHVTGTVQANYFFGKPVNDADITLKASSADVAVFDVATVTGKTDNDGAYHFDITLPAYFAGRPLSQGAAQVLLEATVKDSAAHSEARAEPITVSPSALLITAVPEGGKLVPGLDNQVYLLSAYPDGTPAATQLSVHLPGGSDTQKLTTDSGGIAVLHLKPRNKSSGRVAGRRQLATTLTIDADDHHGSRATSTVTLAIARRRRPGPAPRQPRRLPHRRPHRPAGLLHQTAAARPTSMSSRTARPSSPATSISPTATPSSPSPPRRRCPARSTSAPTSSAATRSPSPTTACSSSSPPTSSGSKPPPTPPPTSPATTRASTSTSPMQRRSGVSAALGLQVVDEAVFALAEQQPGFAKVFFYLEQEAMKPRYEIHSLSMNERRRTRQRNPRRPAGPRRASPLLRHRDAQPQPAATWSSAAPCPPATTSPSSTATRRSSTPRSRTSPRDSASSTRRSPIPATPSSSTQNSPLRTPHAIPGAPSCAFERRCATGTQRLRDSGYYEFRSAGPDRVFDTPDDLTVNVMVRSKAVRIDKAPPRPRTPSTSRSNTTAARTTASPRSPAPSPTPPARSSRTPTSNSAISPPPNSARPSPTTAASSRCPRCRRAATRSASPRPASWFSPQRSPLPRVIALSSPPRSTSAPSPRPSPSLTPHPASWRTKVVPMADRQRVMIGRGMAGGVIGRAVGHADGRRRCP
jgi:hypothetical protein